MNKLPDEPFSGTVERRIYWTLFQYPTNTKNLLNSIYKGTKSKGGSINKALKSLLRKEYIKPIQGAFQNYVYDIKKDSWHTSPAIEKRGSPKYFTVTDKLLLQYMGFTNKNKYEYLLLQAALNISSWRKHLLSKNQKPVENIHISDVKQLLQSEIIHYLIQCFPLINKTSLQYAIAGEAEVPTLSRNIILALVKQQTKKKLTEHELFVKAHIVTETKEIRGYLQAIHDYPKKQNTNAKRPRITPKVLQSKKTLNSYTQRRIAWERDNLHWVKIDLWLHDQNHKHLLYLVKHIHPDVAEMLRFLIQDELEQERRKKKSSYLEQLLEWQKILGKLKTTHLVWDATHQRVVPTS